MQNLSYPIGKFQKPETITSDIIQGWINDIEQLPEQLAMAVHGLSDAQLDTPYRPGGWTVRQVVHHLVDSHVNCYIRFKLALTEDTPTIRPYNEKFWAELPEAKSAPLDFSLDFLAAIHKRWVLVLRSMSAEDMKRKFYHPEDEVYVALETAIGSYHWHGRHHLAHIERLKEREGWE